MLDFLIGTYLGILIVAWTVAIVEYQGQQNLDDKRFLARIILFAPIWPLSAIYLLFRYGIPAVMRFIGNLFVDATRELDNDTSLV